MFDRLVMQSSAMLRGACGVLVLSLSLAGCGGSGAGAGGAGADASSSPVADMMLMADKTALPAADGQTAAVLTVQVKDSGNRVLPDQRVEFSTTDSGVVLAPVNETALSSATTDAAGKVQVKVELGASAAARLNRTVTVVAKSGSLTRTVEIAVAGFRLTLSGPDSLNASGSGDFTVTAVDGSGVPVAALDLNATFSGGTLAASTVKTGANGQASFRLTAGSSAMDASFAVSGSGVSTVSRTVRVLGSDTPFAILTPVSPWVVAVNTDQLVRVRYRPNGEGKAGVPVTLATTRGAFGASGVTTVNTDGNGEATATLRSGAAGPATITASVGSGSSVNSVVASLSFVSVTAAKITLSPDPTSISANAPGSSSSSSRLVATVRDASDNPVTGVTVAFSAQDPSGGRVEPGVVVTGTDGQAIASFIAGPYSTGVDQVNVSANVVGSSTVSATRNMTVSATALFIELGTGNQATVLDTTSYAKPWTALVTDANRNPVANARVTASLEATAYLKGYWSWDNENSLWKINSASLRCASEDTNKNNLLDPLEDLDDDGRLDPGSPAAVTIDSVNGQTGADGRANLRIIYPKNFGGWVEVKLKVTIGGSSGTENSVERTFWLTSVVDDLGDVNVIPPSFGVFKASREPAGPYGYVLDCTDKN